MTPRLQVTLVPIIGMGLNPTTHEHEENRSEANSRHVRAVAGWWLREGLKDWSKLENKDKANENL